MQTKDGVNMADQKSANTTRVVPHGDHSQRGAQTPAPKSPPPMPKIQPAKPSSTTKR